ncbi:MAG: zinc ribbon domain-containing protein [Ruminococcaceae bacterium]|nr:zinc ribbon domain-containing protein [Oscillospiraceae bacterium]
MVCGKCSAINDDGDRFCFRCGAQLPVTDQPEGSGNPGAESYAHQNHQSAAGETFKPTTEDRLAISATTTLAAKKARIADVKAMRPLTQTAYNIVESDRGPVYSTLISLLHVIVSLFIVADIITIFDTVNLIVKSYAASDIEGSITNVSYVNQRGENQLRLIWALVFFVVLILAFIIIGRLSIRIRKVNRKKKRENLNSRID